MLKAAAAIILALHQAVDCLERDWFKDNYECIEATGQLVCNGSPVKEGTEIQMWEWDYTRQEHDDMKGFDGWPGRTKTDANGNFKIRGCGTDMEKSHCEGDKTITIAPYLWVNDYKCTDKNGHQPTKRFYIPMHAQYGKWTGGYTRLSPFEEKQGGHLLCGYKKHIGWTDLSHNYYRHDYESTLPSYGTSR